MSYSPRAALVAAALACFALAGCTPSYVVTHDLSVPLEDGVTVAVGPVEDLLPEGMPAEDRPTLEDIQKFKRYLGEEIEHRDYLGLVITEGEPCRFEIRARLLDYEKGSGFMRFMFGFGAGAAKVLTEVTLVDLEDGSVVFGGNFEGVVTDGLESGDLMFKRVAQDFTREIEKQTGKTPPPTDEIM